MKRESFSLDLSSLTRFKPNDIISIIARTAKYSKIMMQAFEQRNVGLKSRFKNVFK